MGFSLFPDFGILGINARNLQYVRPHNDKKAVKMADNKLSTKQFLSARGIAVPRLIATIRTHGELERLVFSKLPDSFVLKPNSGSGGEGIVVVAGKNKDGTWQSVSGRTLTREFLIDHIRDILDGKYSVADLPDIAFFEQRIVAASLIPDLPIAGLPDVRVIVHNLIPVMAMLRVPTPASDGKANVHLGGYGFGLDMTRGETTYCVQYDRLITRLPGRIPIAGHRIPHWDQILTIASKAQLHTNLGYLAADIALDEKDGPVLIELNARAGLMVQIANRAGLKRRLERVQDLRVESPEKGVTLGKELFGKKATPKQSAADTRTVVSYIEPADIIVGEMTHRVRVEFDPTRDGAAVDQVFARKWKLASIEGSVDRVRLKLRVAGKRIQTIATLTDLARDDYKVILGRRDLAGFLIDPTPQVKVALPKVTPPALATTPTRDIDEVLARIDGRLRLLSYLRPTNLAEEEATFFAANGAYNPTFTYPRLRFDLVALRADLAKLKYPDTTLGLLLKDKATEIRRKLALLEARGTDRFTAASRELYGTPTVDARAAAEERIGQMRDMLGEERATCDAEGAKRLFEDELARYGLTDWRVSLKDTIATAVTVNKTGKIFIRADATFALPRLRGTIAHEIGTHVLRAANGAHQPYRIFSRGTAGYLETEEGLAIWNQEQVIDASQPKWYRPALGLLLVEFALTHSFAEVFAWVRARGFTPDKAWRMTMKAKRGLGDTSVPGAFTKDHLYFSGYQKIAAFVGSGGDIAKLYVGKVTIDDLPQLAKLTSLKSPKYLPR